MTGYKNRSVQKIHRPVKPKKRATKKGYLFTARPLFLLQ
nr:MAG TPA: hypothetical protein [Caudoviricetes sp.]